MTAVAMLDGDVSVFFAAPAPLFEVLWLSLAVIQPYNIITPELPDRKLTQLIRVCSSQHKTYNMMSL